MAARVLLQRRAAASLTATLLAGGIVLIPAMAHAEAPSDYRSKKPIYDDFDASPVNKPSQPPSQPSLTPTIASPRREDSFSVALEPTGPRGPTPTDRLAAQIRVGRLWLYRQASRAEDAVNAGMDRVFDLETSFTSTLASLAPPRESGERLMPGVVYVLVAAMAGSIVARNRGFVLRTATPLVFGVGAAWTVLPITSRNVADLAWRYEKRFPAVADAHLRAREGVEKGWHFAKVHVDVGKQKVDEAVTEARETIESWIRKGK
ncbi:hypothetical protein VTK73DRAFT_4461 [Phialemonium thermophilum]|uniref:MICOS complex subunit n=1 Tax=Phialemonium thermophilum TaxID=223376 RepID=A0ABR3WUB5_9PEZI